MATLTASQRTAQRTQSLRQGNSVKSTVNGSTPTAKLSTYMTSREALWRLLATYPADMPVQQAVLLARVDFTKCRKGGTV